MSKSPLSGAFADSSATTKKKSKKNGAILLISGIALATSIGGVFAANSITIANVQFGQGASDAVSCTTDATTSITQEYVDDDFKVDEVTVSTTGDCSEFNLIVTLLDEDDAVLYTSGAQPGPAAAGAIVMDLSGLDTRISAGDVDTITVTTE